jgi:catechol 2,3-dioxygenase-like lactoylglutathione lyase family enzyme
VSDVTKSTLGQADLVAFAASADLERARTFYEGALGLPLLHQDGYACLFSASAKGTKLRVTLVQQVAVAPYTVLGWEVADIESIVKDLVLTGVVFEQFEGIEQDELGIWTSPDRSRVAWFKDPDGNILSVAQTG